MRKKGEKISYTIYDTLLSEQFSTHFGGYCVVTRSKIKPTDGKEYLEEL